MKTPTSIRTTTLNHFQIQAAKMMLEGQDYKAIGIQVNKDQSTIRRWSNLPEFQEMLQVGKTAAFQECSVRLASSMFLSACALESVLLDPDTRAGDRIKAATEILNYSLKLSENLDLQNRIRLLELASTVEADDES